MRCKIDGVLEKAVSKLDTRPQKTMPEVSTAKAAKDYKETARLFYFGAEGWSLSIFQVRIRTHAGSKWNG